MATCPRCLGPLSEGHRCRPLWRKRLWRRTAAALLGGAIGAFVQGATMETAALPVMGFVIGGLFFFGLWEAMSAE